MSEEQKPTPPNTISDKKWAGLQRRAAKAKTRSPFDPAEVRRREADQKQARNRRWS